MNISMRLKLSGQSVRKTVKEVVDGKSYIELGDEENQALQQAVAGRMGDADLGRKVNDVIQKDVSVD